AMRVDLERFESREQLLVARECLAALGHSCQMRNDGAAKVRESLEPRRLFGGWRGKRRDRELREPRTKRIQHRGAGELHARARLDGGAEQYRDPGCSRGWQCRQR